MGSACTCSMCWHTPLHRRTSRPSATTPPSRRSAAARPTIDSRSIWFGDRARTVIVKGRDTASSMRKRRTESDASPELNVSSALNMERAILSYARAPRHRVESRAGGMAARLRQSLRGRTAAARAAQPPRVAQARVILEASGSAQLSVESFPVAKAITTLSGALVLVTERKGDRAEGGVKSLDLTSPRSTRSSRPSRRDSDAGARSSPLRSDARASPTGPSGVVGGACDLACFRALAPGSGASSVLPLNWTISVASQEGKASLRA